MGTYASRFRNDDEVVSDMGFPQRADWITSHATTSGLAIVEVERLWHRFQQLGCNEKGELPAATFNKPPISEDIFMKNILTVMRDHRKENAPISFLTFLNAMTWAETASTETKIRAIFHLANNGRPIDKETLQKVLKRLYPSESEINLQRTAGVVMQELDPKKSGYIMEEQVVMRILRMPPDVYEPLLQFEIIPSDINEEAHRQFTSLASVRQDAYQSPPSPPNILRQQPSDSKLEQIATKIHKRDWILLANRLHLTSRDISEIQNSVGNDKYEQCLEMMKTWRNREGREAYGEVLEKALRESSMVDAALLLQP